METELKVEKSCTSSNSGADEDNITFDESDSSLHFDENDSFDSNNNNCENANNISDTKPTTISSAPSSSSSQSSRKRKTKRLCVSRSYGLRPRTQLRRPSYECELEEREKEPPSSTRRERSKGRGRSPVVSKCRRLTANARERQRMQEINEAFSTLRGVLPSLQSRPSSRISMTKIRTLRLAASYIQTLSDLLSGSEASEMQQQQQHQGHNESYNENAHNNNTFSHSSVTYDDRSISKLVQQESNMPNPRHVDYIPEHLKGTLNNNNTTRTQQPPQQYTNAEGCSRSHQTWAEMQTADEELFSLLEKEVLSMRSHNSQDAEDTNANLQDINWNDDGCSPLGCK